MNDLEYKPKIASSLLDLGFADMRTLETIAALTKKVFELEMKIEKLEKKQND